MSALVLAGLLADVAETLADLEVHSLTVTGFSVEVLLGGPAAVGAAAARFGLSEDDVAGLHRHSGPVVTRGVPHALYVFCGRTAADCQEHADFTHDVATSCAEALASFNEDAA